MIWVFPLLFAMLSQGADPEAMVAQGIERAQQGRLEEAEKLWQQALAISPGSFPAAFNLGYMFYSQGQYKKSEPYLAKAVLANPKDFNARYLLGVSLSKTGRPDEALKTWRAALDLRPGDGKLMQVMAVEYGKGGYFQEAAAIAERALASNADNAASYSIAIKAYQDANDHGAALIAADRMVRKFPELARANFEYAYELGKVGRPSEGLPFLRKAMEASDTYEEPFFFYGETLLRDAKWEQAIAALRRAIALKRDYMPAQLALGRALMSAGHYADAQVELSRAVEINPQHPQPHLLLSQLYFRLGEEGLATEEKRLSLRLRKQHPDTMESPQSRPFPR